MRLREAAGAAAGELPALDQNEGSGRDDRLRRKQQAENFPVALRLLPHALRGRLEAVYDVVRVIDDLGDEADGDRIALLEAFDADLDRVWDGGRPDDAVLRRLIPAARACDLPAEPFHRLVAANLQDQKVCEYETFDDLVGYCLLSAAPVGRIVLAVFGVTDPVAAGLSDDVCNALQLLEHWQDVAEDRRAGRIYLPADDRVRFRVRPEDLDAEVSTEPMRRLVAFETGRAVNLLRSGAPLVARLSGWARLAVAGYVAGGWATVDALRESRWDVLAAPVRPAHHDTLRHLATLLTHPGHGGDLSLFSVVPR